MPDLASALARAFEDRYRIERPLGEGGMAIVYLAHDLKHNRQVALKVLRPELAALLGAERFLAEIRTTAGLQHPHILPLFDSGHAESADRSFLYYVMPFIDGETLRQRLDRERQLGVGDTIRIARAVATALDYAHRRGIVHRDIKPENVMLFEGQALVADFGIALAVSQAGGVRVTETGISIGTPHYMSPEQAAADRVLDARTDIYSLGAVTFEMLTGRPPFEASSTPALMSKLMTDRAPSSREERPSVPRHVDAAIQVAMAKLPADRFSSAAAFAEALVDSTFTGGDADDAAPPPARGARWKGLVWPGLAAAAALVAWAGWQRTPAPAPVLRAQIDLPAGQHLAIAPNRARSFDISPDGGRLTWLADSGGTSRIFVRDLSSFDTKALAGTEGALQLFFSPDGDWIGFFRDGSLLRVPVAGGAPIAVCAVPGWTFGGSWGPGDRIVFATDSGLFLVDRPGAPPARVPLSLRFARWPHFVPGGRQVLVTTDSGVTLVDLTSRDATPLLAGSDARYLPTGHLLFLNEDRRVRAVPFDLDRRSITGAEFPVLDNVFRAPGSGTAFFAVAPGSGTLVYSEASFNRTLWLVDRSGRETLVPAEPRGYRFPSVSPDGRRVAVTVDPRPSDLWVIDLERGAAERQQTDAHDGWGVWAPDSRRLAMITGGRLGLAWRTFPFTSDPVPIGFVRPAVYPKQWTADDQLLGYDGRDVVAVSVRDGSVRPLVATPANEREPALSPDGRWLAYESDASGINEIHVQAYPGGGERQPVSRGGGFDPVWARDGSELHFRRGNSILAVAVRTGRQFQVLGPPVELFSGPYDFTQTGNWTLGPGARFLMIKADPTTTTRLQVVFNWFQELTARDRAAGSR